jgi:23S rRNA (adenine2503-C2)-methyltransferase
MPLRLALSLHAADPALRGELMPVNERYPLAQVIAACQAFYAAKRRMVFVEYVMLGGVNDSHAQAVALARLLDPKIFKVNLIPYNPTDSEFTGSSPKAIEAFRATLEEHGLGATIRLTRGRDIEAACGQLAVVSGAA